MIQFYAPDIEDKQMLPEDEARHCIKVLRTRPGSLIEAIDGKGYRYSCRLLSDDPRHASVAIESKIQVEQAWQTDITVAVAPTKNMDRMEWLTEKLTEIGVNRIVPVLCRHSERKEIKIERLQRIAVSAMKQSLKARLPEIVAMTPLNDFISKFTADQRFIAYCDPAIPRRLLAGEYSVSSKSVIILIGPEGDFDLNEIKAVLDDGYIPVTLGDNRLRTETAALVACDTFHIINQLSMVHK
ncbi:16S rRNA (uracil(1498)-N(3))-methyltransferase [Barnesiella sp. WM24]|uniref:16S rRNA (uracil(1498)-N(3))-methyltransferase n=1 Tax=Barnesiella sp. WM24 TaxID=2558278 RepID=UPI0010723239|nr:16S rRNA (uracil(1498)-N(3))-methyltransferase [Barnesiella sp. WM24]TFU92896.1 16S rRNA (uracil(1498)-N(3))-methyltransferase [Barnesiella sp. WM24]